MNDLSRFKEADIKKALVRLIKDCIDVEPASKPAGFIFAGQPGAGKSNLFSEAAKQCKQIVEINGDDYRIHHPNYHEIMKWYPEKMADLTQDFSNAVCQRFMRYLIINKLNFTVEGTGRNPQVPIDTAKFMKQYGYKTNFFVMACKPEISRCSCVYRYWKMVHDGQSPRKVNLDFHDDTVRQLPQALDEVYKAHVMDEFIILNREGQEKWNKDTAHQRPGMALYAFFNASMNRQETQQMKDLEGSINQLTRIHDPYQK